MSTGDVSMLGDRECSFRTVTTVADKSGRGQGPLAQLLSTATTKAWGDFVAELECVPLFLWDEFTFRFFLVRALCNLDPQVHIETEWQRHDLLVVKGNEALIIELKFFMSKLSLADSKGRRRRKGGAGVQNFREFCDAIRKLYLRSSRPSLESHGLNVVGTYLLLVYADGPPVTGAITFGKFYDCVSLGDDLSAVAIDEVVQMDATECKATANKVRCKLLRVTGCERLEIGQ